MKKLKVILIVVSIIACLAIVGILLAPKTVYPDENHPIIYSIDDIEEMLLLNSEDNSLNPYSTFFYYSTTDLSGRKIYDGYYNFLAARDYEKDFEKTVEKELDNFIFASNDMNLVNVFVPYGTDPDEVAEDFENKGILKDFYIKWLSVLVLKEDVDMKKIDEKANQYSDYVYDEFSFQADSSGKLE